MTHTITTDQWAWLYINLQTIMDVDYAHGRGYHMSTDSNLRKWAWLTKEAELRYDVL